MKKNYNNFDLESLALRQFCAVELDRYRTGENTSCTPALILLISIIFYEGAIIINSIGFSIHRIKYRVG